MAASGGLVMMPHRRKGGEDYFEKEASLWEKAFLIFGSRYGMVHMKSVESGTLL